MAVPFSCCAVDSFEVGGPGEIDYTDGYVLALDPRFCARTACESAPATDGDFSLADDSPCLPANNACGVLIGALSTGCSAASAPEHDGARLVEAVAYPTFLRSTDRLQLRLVEGDRRADLFDVTGRHMSPVWADRGRPIDAPRTVAWQLAPVPAGTYYLRIDGRTGSRTTRIVVGD